ncbi:hypothetical protein NOF04DRAFT_1342103 [Fusarium oxysporum II5]|nr:hypothetical protein NOF04DRAFT_1342103 [Fusarium oxysporum II5]
MNRHQYPLKESPDGSSPISLFPQMPLRDLDSEVENIEKLFLLGLSQPAQERDGLKELEANFKESRRQATYRLLSLAPKEISDYYQQLIQRTQPGPHDFHSSPYPQMPTDKILVCRRLQKFLTKELSVTGWLIGTNYQPLDLISAFSALIVAPSLIHQAPGQVKELEQKFNEDLGRWKTLSTQNQPDPFGLFQEVNEGLPPRVANMHPFNPNVFAQLQSVAFDFFLQASSGKSSMPCLCRYLD